MLKQANSDLPRGMPRDKQSVMGEGKTRPDPAMLHVAADGVKVPLGANARLGSARLGSARLGSARLTVADGRVALRRGTHCWLHVSE